MILNLHIVFVLLRLCMSICVLTVGEADVFHFVATMHKGWSEL